MACPHIAGLAVYLAVAEDISSPSALSARIKELGTSGGATSTKNGTPNLVAFNGVA